MKAKVIGIEKHPTSQTNIEEARAGETCGLLLELINTTQDAAQIGSQKGPSSVSKIQAETKQVRKELDLDSK